jgi:glucose/arabinose dehydrogenase
MSDDIEQDVVPAAEEPEEPETPEAEEPENPGGQPNEPEENLEQIRKDAKAYKDQKVRAEKAERELKSLRNGGKDRVPNKDGHDLSNEDGDRIARAEDRSERSALRSLGITHADDIEYVRNAAKRLGIDVEEAAEDEFVKSKLDRMQATRKSKEATPDPSRRGGSSRNTKLPDFSKMSNAEFDKWEKENR